LKTGTTLSQLTQHDLVVAVPDWGTLDVNAQALALSCDHPVRLARVKRRVEEHCAMVSLAVGTALVGFGPPALAEPPPISLDRALGQVLALGDADGCSTPFGIPDFSSEQDPQSAHDAFIADLRDTGQLGREIAAVCGSSAVASAAALGGSLGSLQTTKTVSQFRLARRRLDSRLEQQDKKSGLGRAIRLAALGEPVRPPLTDTPGLEAAPQSGPAVFGQIEYERRDRAVTELEAGYEADIASALIGIDYATPNGVVVGAWAGYRDTNAGYKALSLFVGDPDLSRELEPALAQEICRVGPGGGFDDRGAQFGAFLGKRFGRGFADLAAQYSRRDYDYRRNICAIEGGTGIIPDPASESGFSSSQGELDDIYAGTISGSTRLTEWSVSARAGYDFGNDRFLWGPRISITYLDSKVRPFTETGRTSVTNTVRGNGEGPDPNDPTVNTTILVTPRGPESPTGLELAFDEQSRTSLQSEVQLVAAYRFETRFGTMIPRISGSWIHEYRADRDLVTVRMAQDLRATPTRFTFTTDRVDEDKGAIAIGLTAFIGRELTADIELSRLVGDDLFDSTIIRALARWRL
jgi:Autotransporter beta-domain